MVEDTWHICDECVLLVSVCILEYVCVRACWVRRRVNVYRRQYPNYNPLENVEGVDIIYYY